MSNDEDPSPPSSQVAPNAIRGDDARALTVQVADPAAANSRPLIAALDAYLVQLYPPASNHLLSIAELQQPNVTFLTAEVGGRIAGCGAYVNHHGEYAEIKRMFILPEFRGERLGHCILAELESLARAAGLKLARLEAGVSQPAALRLYEQAGYQRRGRFGDYPDDPLSVFMEKSLHRGAQAAVASQPMGSFIARCADASLGG